MGRDELTERELRILEAVVQTYIETAEPAGSQRVARKFGLGVSPATIRSTMSELEERGYLFHPHTSAGRVPTDLGYRAFVDQLAPMPNVGYEERERLRQELMTAAGDAIEGVLRRAAQALGVLTQELGVAAAPVLDEVVLERLEVVPVASDRLLLVFNLRSGVVRTIFVQVRGAMPPEALQAVVQVLNERLGGLTLRQIRASLRERLRDTGTPAAGQELLDIFVAQGDGLFDLQQDDRDAVLLGSARLLADQPEFASNERMRDLLHLTEQRDLLREALERRRRQGLAVTIGVENDDPRLAGFTLVTASYRAGDLSGVIGVMGPTRMPYEKVIGLVLQTSRLVEGILQ